MTTSLLSVRGVVLTLGVCAAFSGTSSAQIDAGLLGKQYAGVSLFAEDAHHYDIGTGYGGGVNANFPIAPKLDFALATSYERFNDVSLTDKRLFGSLVAYQEFSGLKVFADGTLGGTWQSVRSGGMSFSNNDGIYAIGAGVEAPITPGTALFGRIAYNKYFDSSNGDYWTYSAGFNHWINEKWGVIISITSYDSDSIVYGIGAALRF